MVGRLFNLERKRDSGWEAEETGTFHYAANFAPKSSYVFFCHVGHKCFSCIYWSQLSVFFNSGLGESTIHNFF